VVQPSKKSFPSYFFGMLLMFHILSSNALAVQVVDVETEKTLGPRENGEICMRGPQQMKCYLNRPQATADMVDLQGFIHTGDVFCCWWHIDYHDYVIYMYILYV